MIITGAFFFAGCQQSPKDNLQDVIDILNKKKFVDLSHSFSPGIPHWHGFPDEIRTVIYAHDKGEGTMGDGFFAEQFQIVGQWGTHLDPPVHFIKGGRCIDEITPKEMILPLVVIDVHLEVEQNADYVLTTADLLKWEQKHGKIPEGAFVAMRSDWSKFWPDSAKMENKDSLGVSHYPGWSIEALQFLVEKRKITAIGHETTDTDPGIKTSRDNYESEIFILSQNKYQIEMLTNLDQLPEKGAIVFIGVPKPHKGSGFPTRVIAVVP